MAAAATTAAEPTGLWGDAVTGDDDDEAEVEELDEEAVRRVADGSCSAMTHGKRRPAAYQRSKIMVGISDKNPLHAIKSVRHKH